HALRLGISRVSWNADGSRTITSRVGEVDRRFEPGHQTLVTVGGRIGDAGEGRGVLQDSPDKEEGHVTQTGVTVASKERFFIFPKRHVGVHAGTIVSV